MSEDLDPTVAPSGPGCVDCEATGGWWLHLRRCAACGHIGCCDTSPSQHATAHFRTTGHRYIQSFEPGEDWYWDFTEDNFAEGPILADPTSHPSEQTVPGPAERVPSDWKSHLH
jgi:Zn-finger in ubiquitin-hydrolases and other protein